MSQSSVHAYTSWQCINEPIYTSAESDEEIVWELSDADSDLHNDMSVDSVAVSNATPSPNPTFQESMEFRSAQSIVQWIVGFLFILQSKYHLPNSAIDFITHFIAVLLCVLGKFSPFVRHVQNSFPPSLHIMRKKCAGYINFHKYPICPKCRSLYNCYEECVEKSGSCWTSKHCSHVDIPNHPHQSRRASCNTVLMKSVHLRSGRTILYPLKTYCYNGLKPTLQRLLLCPYFIECCDLWKTRPVNSHVSDIYDGKVWKYFLNYAGTPFLQASFTFGLMLNIDWFQPYKHTISSVGVIYLNLPRTLRFKVENLIIVGIIPGPSEPQHDINSLYTPSSRNF